MVKVSTCIVAMKWYLMEQLRRAIGIGNSSTSHIDNQKNYFLVLGERVTDDINAIVGTAEKKFDINFSNAKTKFSLILHYNVDNSYLFLNGKEICKFNAKNNFPTQLCLGGISEKICSVESRKVSFEKIMYDFSVDFDAVDKADTLKVYNLKWSRVIQNNFLDC